MITDVLRFLLIFGIVIAGAFGVVTGIGESIFPQLGALAFVPQTVILALLLWFILWRISKHSDASREKEYHSKLEGIRNQILSEAMAKARASAEADKKQPDLPTSTGAYRIENTSDGTVTIFNKESVNEVNEQLSNMLYFMSYNFKAYTVAAFIYDPHRRMLVLNCYHSKSVHIIEKAQIPFGSGFVGQVASENRLFMSGDISFYKSDSAGGHAYYTNQESVSSVLAVPLTVGSNELIGVLLIDSKDKNVFKEQDKELMKRFSTIAAALIVNIRMSANLEQAAKTFRLFYEASHNFSVALKTDDIFNALFAVVPRITPSCVRLVLTAFDASRSCFVIQRVTGQKFELNEGMELPLAAGLYSFAFNKSKVVNIPDLAVQGNKHYRFAPNEPANPAIRSFIVFPILGGDGKCIGLFSIESGDPGLFNGQVEQILTTVVENAAVAINRSLLYRKMEKLATTDGLTGLNNHRTFQEFMDNEFERARRYSRPLSLLLTDIDHFKSFNDTYGHPVGDMVLREVAQCIRNAVRTNDIPARYGGEEFAVIVPESDENGAAIIAERIRSSVESRVIMNDGNELRVTISIGCSSFPPHGNTKQDLIDSADKALYAAKRSGRNRVCIFSPEMTMS
ncbi:MAG: diguanylate cyclase [Chitinispirillia bacterium]|nr:diguanylate cyclase [Chitinispirillia bacterium]